MTEIEKNIRIFLSYAFKPKQSAYTQSEIQQVLEKSVKVAKESFGERVKNIQIKLDYELTEYGEVLRTELLSKIAAADIFIVDISDNNPNVFYELGYIDAMRKDKAIIIKSSKESDLYKVPSDISDKFYLRYDHIEDIVDKLANALKKRIEEILDAPPGLKEIRRLWFPKNTNTIHVIGPKSQAETEFSQITSSNYAHFHRIGDKDAMWEILLLLSRLYPHADIKKYMAEDFDIESGLLNDNLVIVGGPGGTDDEGNRICKLISERMNSSVTYSDDCESMLIENKDSFSSLLDDKKSVKTDYGYFGRIQNPLNSNSTVILVHGIHTFGVLGSVRAFSDNPNAKKNVEKILDKLGLNPYFESWFPVDVMSGAVIPPRIDDKNIRKKSTV